MDIELMWSLLFVGGFVLVCWAVYYFGRKDRESKETANALMHSLMVPGDELEFKSQTFIIDAATDNEESLNSSGSATLEVVVVKEKSTEAEVVSNVVETPKPAPKKRVKKASVGKTPVKKPAAKKPSVKTPVVKKVAKKPVVKKPAANT